MSSWQNSFNVRNDVTELDYVLQLLQKGKSIPDIIVEVNRIWKNNRTENALRIKLCRKGYVPTQVSEATREPSAQESVTVLHSDNETEDNSQAIQLALTAETRRNQRLRDRLRITNRKMRELIRAQNSLENLDDVIAEYVEHLPRIEPTAPLEPAEGKLKRAAVLHISDIHCGETVKSAHALGSSEFNFQVIAEYFANLEAQLLELLQRRLTGYQIDHLVIAINGDLISGVIHDELIETADGTVAEATILIGRLLSLFIARLSTLAVITVICTIGNHARLKKDKVYKNKWANWDMIVSKYLEISLADYSNVSVYAPAANMVPFHLEGCTYLLVHGDALKGGKGLKNIREAANRLNPHFLEKNLPPIQHVMIGHFHDPAMGHGASINGGWPGYSEYTQDLFYLPVPPQQLFWIAEPYGPGLTYSIHLDISHPQAETKVYLDTIGKTWPHRTIKDFSDPIIYLPNVA